MENILIFVPLMIVGLDWVLYLAKVWWAFTGKNDIDDIMSPVYEWSLNRCRKTGNSFWGEGFYGCGFCLCFGVGGVFVMLILMTLIQNLGVYLLYGIGAIGIFVAFTFGTRAIRTLLTAVKSIAKVAHKHENGEVVTVDIPVDTLTTEERDIIDGLRKKLKK